MRLSSCSPFRGTPRAIFSISLIALVTNCLVASDGHEPPPSASGSVGAGGTSRTTAASTTTGSAGKAGSNGSAGATGTGSECSGPTPIGARVLAFKRPNN